jgi:hypothetical protein
MNAAALEGLPAGGSELILLISTILTCRNALYEKVFRHVFHKILHPTVQVYPRISSLGFATVAGAISPRERQKIRTYSYNDKILASLPLH